jgi:shikimate kinase
MTDSQHSTFNIILTGFMGAGKTSVGREAAARLGRRFVDLDDLIVARAGKSIPAIFAEDGEPAAARSSARPTGRRWRPAAR